MPDNDPPQIVPQPTPRVAALAESENLDDLLNEDGTIKGDE